MRIVATSDFHGYLPDTPECDLLLIAGDVTPYWDHDRQFQADWLRDEFAPWLDAQPAELVYWTAGNHDGVLQDWRTKRHKIDALGGCYLDNETRTAMISERLQGRTVKIWGTPYSNRFGNWAFMQEEGPMADIYRHCPRDVEIIISHGPPLGYGDAVAVGSYSAEKRDWELRYDKHVGCAAFANQLAYDEWPNLKLVIFGHIHEGYGRYEMNGVQLLNVAHVDDKYNPVNEPMVIDL